MFSLATWRLLAGAKSDSEQRVRVPISAEISFHASIGDKLDYRSILYKRGLRYIMVRSPFFSSSRHGSFEDLLEDCGSTCSLRADLGD